MPTYYLRVFVGQESGQDTGDPLLWGSPLGLQKRPLSRAGVPSEGLAGGGPLVRSLTSSRAAELGARAGFCPHSLATGFSQPQSLPFKHAREYPSKTGVGMFSNLIEEVMSPSPRCHHILLL